MFGRSRRDGKDNDWCTLRFGEEGFGHFINLQSGDGTHPVRSCGRDGCWGNLFAEPAAFDPGAVFPILPWSPLHGWKPPFEVAHNEGLASMRLVTSPSPVSPVRRPPECERLGLAAIVIPDSGFIAGKEWRNLSDAAIDRMVRSIVEKTKKVRLSWDTSSATNGSIVVSRPRQGGRGGEKVRAGKLAYINLFPDYATLGAKDVSQLETPTYAEYLERYTAEVKPQFVSYDNYMVQYSLDLREPAKAASYYKNLLDVRRVALASAIPFWNIVSSNQVRKFTTIPSPANLAHQAYTTLAAGGRGLSWYTYYAGGYGYAPVDSAAQRPSSGITFPM